MAEPRSQVQGGKGVAMAEEVAMVAAARPSGSGQARVGIEEETKGKDRLEKNSQDV